MNSVRRNRIIIIGQKMIIDLKLRISGKGDLVCLIK